MSERLLVSPGPLLDALSKEMEFRLDHYPTMAMNHEKIESFFNRLQQLFNGGYRSVRFQTAKLHSCITLFCKCILIFIKDATDVKREELIFHISRWLAALDNIGDIESIKNKFTYFVPILKDSMLKKAPPWFIKEFLFHLNIVFEKANQSAEFDKAELKFFLKIVTKWLKLIMTCGDYEFQTIVVKNIINICEKDHIVQVFQQKLGNSGRLLSMFLAVHGQKNYVNDLQVLLSTINDSFKKVHSVPCLKVTLQETDIPPLKGMNGDVTWMHINYGFRTVSFSCHRDSLRNLPCSDAYSNVDEFVAVNFEDVDEILLLINNDKKMNNLVAGMFLMKLTKQCSCRFNSSREMVSSIKKIFVMVPGGSHLEFLKEEFPKLFGDKFKQDVQIPNKKRSFSRKKDSTLNSSQHSLSLKAENRRRMKRGTDSATSSQGSFLMRNLKLNNSFTLENEESVLEDTNDCFLITTGMRSNKPVVHESKDRKLINNKENVADRFSINTKVNETKEDESIMKSKDANDMKTNLSSKSKVDVENSQNRLSISPDTTTHLEKENDSLIDAPHFTKKLSTGKKEKMRQKQTNSLFLKNSDVDNLSTFPHEENPMTEDSEIFLTNTLPNKEESTEISSVYIFDKDCSISIVEENRDSLIDFINTELCNISDLNIHEKENISPCKVKNKKQNRNFEIADSSSISVNSSVQKSASKAKNDGLDLDVPFASSSIKEINQKKDEREDVHEITSKRKKNVTSFGISNNSLEHSPRNLPNKVQTRSSLNRKLKISDSCTFQNTDEIVGGKKNKNKSVNARLGLRKRKARTKIDPRCTIEKTKLTNEKVTRDLEILTDGQIAEESEYYSFIPDNVSTEVNKESNQLSNYSKTFVVPLGKSYTMEQLINMNTEEIGNVESVKMKEDEYEGPENDNLLTLDSPIVNAAESEYYSCEPDFTSTENNEINYGIRNSATLEMYFNAGSNGSIGILNKHEQIPKANSLMELAKINDSCIENNTEQLIEYNESENFKLTVQANKLTIEESEYFSSAYYQGSNQQNSETPDLDFILANRSSIVSPSVDSKNVNTKISTTLEKELVKRDHSYKLKKTKKQLMNKEVIQRNDNLIMKGNRRGKTIMKPWSNTLKNGNNENTNEEASIANIRLSTETVKIDICSFHKNDDNISVISISSDGEIYSDVELCGNIREVIQDVPTLSSKIVENYQIVNNSFADEQIENKLDDDVINTNEVTMDMQISDVIQDGSEHQNEIDDHLNIITELDNCIIQPYSEIVKTTVTEFEQIEDDSIAKEKIENDIAEAETNEDIAIFQISEINDVLEEIIIDGSVNEKQEESDDKLNITFTTSIQESVLAADLDNKTTEISPEIITDVIENKPSSFEEDVEVKIDYDSIVKNDSDIEIIQIHEINKSIKNNHYVSGQALPHEIKTEIENDEDTVSNKGNGDPGSTDKLSVPASVSDTRISVSKEINDVDMGYFDFQLAQLTDVPISLKEIVVENVELLKKSSQILENDVVDLEKENSDESLMYLVNNHQQNLDESMENLEDSFTLMKSKNMEHVRNKVSCEQDKLTNAYVALNKINVLSNVRIAPPHNKNINQSKNDDQLAKEKYTATVDELPKTNAKVDCAMQQPEELELTSKLQTNQVNKKKSVKVKKRKMSQKRKTRKSQDNPEISKERNHKINSFSEFVKSNDEKIEKTENNLKNLEKTRYLPTKKILLNKFNESQQGSTKSVLKTNTSMESNSEMLGTRSEKLNSPKPELNLNILSPQKSLLDGIATNEKKNAKQVTHKLQKPKEVDYFEEFISFVSNKSPPLNNSTEKENNIKLSQNGEINDFEKLKVPKKKMNDYEEFPLTLQSKKRLLHESATSKTQKRRKLTGDVQLSHEIHQAKEDNFEILTPEKIQFNKFNVFKTSTPRLESTQKMQKSEVSDCEMMERATEDSLEMFNERKTSTPYVESTQKMQKSEVSDWEMIERAIENGFEMLTSEKIPFEKFNERKTSTSLVESAQKIQKFDLSDCEMIEKDTEDSFEMLALEKVQFKKFNGSKTSTPHVELNQNIQKSKVSDSETIERVNEDNCEVLIPKKRQLKKFNERKKSTPCVESTQNTQKSKVSDWEMIERAKDDSFEMPTLENIQFEKFNEWKTSTPRVESTQKIQKSKVSDWETIERDKEEGFEMLALEKIQFKKFNGSKTSTSHVELNQKNHKSKVSNSETLERVNEDNCEVLIPKKRQFKKFKECKKSTPYVESTQKIQKSKVNDYELMERDIEDSFEMCAPKKIQYKKFNGSKTSTPHVELNKKIQKSKVSDWETIERVNEDNCEVLTPKKRQFKKFNERKKSTPYVELIKNTQKSKVSDWEMIERVKEDDIKILTPKKLQFEDLNERKKLTPHVESTQNIQKSKAGDWEMIETDKVELDQLKEFVSICKTSEKSFAACKSKKKLIDVQLTPKMRKSESIDEHVNFIQQDQSVINLPHLDRGEPVKKKKLIKAPSVSRKQNSKENGLETLPVINEEFGLSAFNSIASGSEWNQNIDFNWDDFKIGKENNDRLYNILNHPRRVYTICDKTGEALKFGKPVGYKGKEVQNDEEFYKVADSMYGFDAMLFALRSYLKTCDSTQKKKRKPQKKTITKMKLYTPKKAKSKSQKKKYGKLS